MSIELTFNSVTVSSEEIQKYYPFLISELGHHRTTQRSSKKRKRKKKKTAGALISEIIAQIDENQLCPE